MRNPKVVQVFKVFSENSGIYGMLNANIFRPPRGVEILNFSLLDNVPAIV